MKRKQKRQFDNREEAMAYLKERGDLQYFGRDGHRYEYCVYTLTLPSGKKYGVDVYDDGRVEVVNEFN